MSEVGPVFYRRIYIRSYCYSGLKSSRIIFQCLENQVSIVVSSYNRHWSYLSHNKSLVLGVVSDSSSYLKSNRNYIYDQSLKTISSLYLENAYFWQDLFLQKSEQKKNWRIAATSRMELSNYRFPALTEFKVIYVTLCGVSYIPSTSPFLQRQLHLSITTLDAAINVQRSSIFNCHHFRPSLWA